ncbi:MAG: AAA family ATPase [Chloroflexi bacterium]|nr:AAA family ATPase [Chloroflexota bacterium]
MATQILATKLYAPVPRPGVVQRPRLIDRLKERLRGKLTLLSAPAGFGKTTLVTEWINADERPVGWLSLDEADSDLVRFLSYFVAALQTIAPQIGTNITNLLGSPQPPAETLLTTLLNDIAAIPGDFVFVLDDYHVLDSQVVNAALTFLIDNQPANMHLVITTREDPRLPLARLRARGELTELRASDLHFTLDEAAEFLNHAMGLAISPDDVAALEARTEGWIAGLQLAAISMQGQQDTTEFIKSFTGSHHFVLDYLVEEVLSRQPPHIHDFLLKTSILDRMCGPLCDAVLQDDGYSAEETLEGVRQANLFLVPLDNERRWYRYHHLFGDLLRKRLRQTAIVDSDELHIRASRWYEDNDFEIEAFQHAAAANDVERAERIISGTSVPLYFRGVAHPILHWFESLPSEILNASPSLWITYAWTLMAAHQSTQIEHKLQSAEAVLSGVEQDARFRDLLGNIAAIRAMEAAIRYQADTIITQARRALDLLHRDNLYIRTVVTRALAIAYQFQGKRAAARETYQEAIAMSDATGNLFVNVLATTGLGIIQTSDNELYQAAQTYKRVLDLVVDPNQPITCASHLGLARIHYEWNDLEAAQVYGERGVRLAHQIESIDSAAGGEVFLARLQLAKGNVPGALNLLNEVEEIVHRRGFAKQIPSVAAVRVLLCLHQGDVTTAAQLAQAHNLPLSQARVHLAQGNPAEALVALGSYREQIAAETWPDERLKVLVLLALAHHQDEELDEAITVISEALASAAPGGFVRTFIDEGQPMRTLLSEAAARGVIPEYTRKLLDAFPVEHRSSQPVSAQPLIEALSDRELEILALVAEGLSNREISERLFLALSTVKGHNRNIFDKLQVKRRTEAVARARKLGLI